MGFEPTTLRDLVRCSNHWATGDSIDYFPIAHNTLCLPPKFCITYCLGKIQYSQEHLKTMVYAEFGGQTECIMGNWKIENGVQEWK